MRTKTQGGKPRPCNSKPPSNSSLCSIRLLYQDEANEEYHVDGNNQGALVDSGFSQDDDDDDDDGCGGGGENDGEDNDDGCDVYDDNDDVVVPDSVEEVDRRAGENHGAGPSIDCIVVNWLEREFCIRCNSGSGQLLVCSENGCPVAIHEACMNYKPEFDNMGKFYCPYCRYKRLLMRTKELRRNVMLAKKELSNFICLKRDGGNEEKQEDETKNMKVESVSTMAGKINTGYCENGLNDDGNERIHHNQEETPGVQSISRENFVEERNSRAHGFENVGDGETIQEEDIENASDSEDDEIEEDRWRIQPSSTSHLETVKCKIHVSINGTNDIVGVLEENRGKRVNEEPVLPNAVGTTMALITEDATSKMPAIKSFQFVSPDLDNETLAVEENQGKRGQEEPVLSNAVGTTIAQITGDATSKMPAIESVEFVSPYLANETLAVEENQQKRGKEEPLLSNAVGTTMTQITGNATSKMPAIESFEFVSPDLDNETLTVRQKRVKRRAQKAWPDKVDSPKIPSSEPSTSANDTMMNQQGKATAGENSVQCQESTERLVIPTLGTDLENETLQVRLKRIKRSAHKARPQKVDSPTMSSSGPSTGAKDKKMNQQGKATAGENSVQCQESTKRLMIPTFSNEKRRRLYWTVEEEDMLKEGMHRFSTTVNKNIPWRKILEFGHQVFHETRTPADLKDKWKNIMAKEKEVPKGNKGVLIKS